MIPAAQREYNIQKKILIKVFSSNYLKKGVVFLKMVNMYLKEEFVFTKIISWSSVEIDYYILNRFHHHT